MVKVVNIVPESSKLERSLFYPDKSIIKLRLSQGLAFMLKLRSLIRNVVYRYMLDYTPPAINSSEGSKFMPF